MRARFWSLCFLAALVGCRARATQLVVVANTDFRVPDQVVSLVARVRDGSGTLRSEQRFELSERMNPADPTRFAFPLSFAVVPEMESTPLPRVTIELVLQDARGQVKVTRRAITGFLRNRALVVPMFMPKWCEGVMCPPEDTCGEWGPECRRASVDENTLSQLEPGANPGAEFDASTRLDGAVSETSTEAGLTDASSEAASDAETFDPTIPAATPRWPPHGAIMTGVDPVFRWNAPDTMGNAAVEISPNADFTSPWYRVSATNEVSWGNMITGMLPGDRWYYWRLRGRRGEVLGQATSVTRRFYARGNFMRRGSHPVRMECDLNNDLRADLLIGLPAASAVRGIAGGPSGLEEGRAVTLQSPMDGNGFGRLVLCPGDVNNDGFSDGVVIDATNTAYLIAGAPSLTMMNIRRLGTWGMGVIKSLRSAGDFDGDGFVDVLIVDPSGGSPRAEVRFGPMGERSATLVRPDGSPFEPTSVSGAADVNGDGRSDLLVGDATVSPNTTMGTGRVYFYPGAATPSAAMMPAQEFALSPNDRVAFGTAITAMGNYTGDLALEVLVGAPGLETGVPGRLVLLQGTENGNLMRVSETLTAADRAQDFGAILFGGLRWNTDGGLATLVARRGSMASPVSSVQLVGINPALGFTPVSAMLMAPIEQLLEPQLAVGDYNGDRLTDVVLGAPLAAGDMGALNLLMSSSTAPFASITTLMGNSMMRSYGAVLAQGPSWTFTFDQEHSRWNAPRILRTSL